MSFKRSNYSFSQIPRADIPRSSFNRTHAHKTTFDSGYLVPFFFDEVLPGDTFNLHAQLFARLATPIFPLMDNLYMETQFFFVPNRLLWEHWEQFNGQEDYPGASTDYLIPVSKQFRITEGSLEDYFGLPVGYTPDFNELPIRAYHKIWNDWYRDENLQDPVNLSSGRIIDTPTKLADIGVGDAGWTTNARKLLRRGKRHDYFTSCLPWPQKGPGVELPLSGNAEVRLDQAVVQSGQNQFMVRSSLAYQPGSVNGADGSSGGFLRGSVYSQPSTGNAVSSWLDPNGTMYADLSSVNAATINSLRQAFQIQKLYERDARGGTRYTEILRSHFGVTSPDSRLQRSEYLGGGSSHVIINPVQQTSSTNTTTPQGNLAAYGVVSGSDHGFTKSFVEHGYIIGLVSVRADMTYQQGLNRLWSRKTRFDFYWPALSHLGEQAVLNKEIYCQSAEEDEEVFGYQERWAEYRYYPSKITGKLRSTSAGGSLDSWHLAQYFENLPRLNAEFIVENPPVDRVIAVPSEPHFIFDSYIKLKCARPMPVYSVPGLIDHF